jgi:predicted ATPase
MLKTLDIVDFYEKDNPVSLDLSQGLTILTGDNGVGKTTLLNLIFNIINGDFETVNKTKFSKIILRLDVDDINIKNNSIVHRIEVIKKDDELEISYFLREKKYVIGLKRLIIPYIDHDYSYHLIFPETKKKKNKVSKFNFSAIFQEQVRNNLSDLIRDYNDLSFINLLKENIIYFPTYRRIDSDIIELLEQNYPVINEDELYEINRTINNFPRDRRIVGVNDNDISYLYKNYSEKCRKLNSEGLNRVLKTFVEEMIVNTYKNNPDPIKYKKKKTSKNLYDKAPDQLIDLSRQLGIEDINEGEIREYFAKQKQVAEFSKDGASVDLTITPGKKEDQLVEGGFNDALKDVLLSSLLSIGESNNLVMRLIDLYVEHMKTVNKELEPYEYLKSSFDTFFKTKININFNNFNLQLSRPLEHLSTGEKQLITILSYAALSLKRTIYKPLIIIDEPELSLHISWQLKLIKKLLELPSSNNILLATHSPYIANSDYENFIWQLGDIDEY